MLQLLWALSFLVGEDSLDELTWPLPTLEITKLVEAMGDEDFEVREKATKQLQAKGWDAILAIKHGLKHKDLEVRRRCQDLYKAYFIVDNKVSIFQLDLAGDFKLEKESIKIIDVEGATDYYRKAWFESGRTEDEGMWHDSAVGKVAMMYYVNTLLHRGVSKKLVAQLIADSQKRPIEFPMMRVKD